LASRALNWHILKGKRVYDEYVLQDGDELVFLAPIGGG
jgi:molybdopterin converting factor small subunit